MNTKLLRALSLTALGLGLVGCGATTPSSSQEPAEPKTVVVDTSKNAESKSKRELGDAYNMKTSTQGCEYEWYEQAEIIEEAALDKTAQEITALVKNEGDLAGATIYLSNYLAALAKATTYAGLEHVGPQAE